MFLCYAMDISETVSDKNYSNKFSKTGQNCRAESKSRSDIEENNHSHEIDGMKAPVKTKH